MLRCCKHPETLKARERSLAFLIAQSETTALLRSFLLCSPTLPLCGSYRSTSCSAHCMTFLGWCSASAEIERCCFTWLAASSCWRRRSSQERPHLNQRLYFLVYSRDQGMSVHQVVCFLSGQSVSVTSGRRPARRLSRRAANAILRIDSVRFEWKPRFTNGSRG